MQNSVSDKVLNIVGNNMEFWLFIIVIICIAGIIDRFIEHYYKRK